MDDKNRNHVDMIANALDLQLVGHLFTRANKGKDAAILESAEIRRMARMQQEYVVDHPLGFKVSKLVTVVLQPNGDDISDIDTQVFMISDQGQALERDNVFGNSDKTGKMVVRE